MNNQIEFVVKMRDLMSGGMNRLSSASQSSFNRMSAGAQAVTTRNQILGMSFDELQKKIHQTENTIKSSTIPSQIREARRELEALQRQSSKHSGNIGGGALPTGGKKGLGIGGVAIGSMLGGVALQAGSAIVGAIGSGVGSIISKTMEKEQAITGLTTFLGKQGATDAYSNIRKDAAATPFDTASLLEVNRSLISAGLNAKDARKDTLNLANAVSAVGGGNDVLSRMAANMQQIKTVGKATSMDIRQFGIAGINIYEMLAKSTGKNINQVKEMDVTYEQLQKALAMSAGKGGIYEGAMEAQSQTKAGKWATFKDNVGNAASDIGDAFSPVFDKLLGLAVKFAEWIPKGLAAAQPFINMLSGSVGRVIDYIMQIVDGTSAWSGWVAIIRDYFLMIWGHVSNIFGKVMGLVTKIMEFIKKSEILKDIFRFVGFLVDNLGMVLADLVDSVTMIWDNVIAPILNALDAAYKWIKGKDDINVKSTRTLITTTPKKPEDKPSPFADNKKLVESNNASGKETGSSVVGGGPKTININLGKFFENIHFNTLNGSESAQELEQIVMECLGRVLYQGSKVI